MNYIGKNIISGRSLQRQTIKPLSKVFNETGEEDNSSEMSVKAFTAQS